VVLCHAKIAGATPANGFVGTTIAQGRLEQFEVFNHFILPNTKMNDDDRKVWHSWQKTRGSSDLYIQSNLWQPGGTTGWHSHPGHSLIVVIAGTVTDYEGDDHGHELAARSLHIFFRTSQTNGHISR